MGLPDVRGGSDLPRTCRAEFDDHRDGPTETLIDQILLVLEVLAEFVENLAAFRFRWITREHEVHVDLVDNGLVLEKAALQLEQKLVLLLVLGLRAKDAFHPIVDHPLKDALELRVGLRPLELEEVQVARLSVEVKAVEAVVIAAKRDLRDCVLALDAELVLQVQQAEVVVAYAAAGVPQVRKCLVNGAIGDCHVERGPSVRPDRASSSGTRDGRETLSMKGTRSCAPGSSAADGNRSGLSLGKPAGAEWGAATRGALSRDWCAPGSGRRAPLFAGTTGTRRLRAWPSELPSVRSSRPA